MNSWKRAFLVLAILNVAAISSLLLYIYRPFADDQMKMPKSAANKDVPLTITANKSNLNALINQYLKKQNENKALKYEVYVDDDVRLYGSVPAFGDELDLTMTFRAEVRKNGDVLLHQEMISLGKMNLPVPLVMRYVKDHYSLPNWVYVNPKDETIYVALTKMELKSGLKARVKNLDLKKDDIRFELLVPVD